VRSENFFKITQPNIVAQPFTSEESQPSE